MANKGEPFLKNYEQIQYPASDALEFYPMPPVKGAITVNIGAQCMVISWLLLVDQARIKLLMHAQNCTLTSAASGLLTLDLSCIT